MGFMMINPFIFAPPVTPPGQPPPTDVSDLQLWLPVSAITGIGDGGAISSWPDQSGNSRNATGTGTSSKKPQYKTSGGPNGGPRVRLTLSSGDGGDQRYFTLPNFLTSFTAGEAFIVLILDADPSATSGLEGIPLSVGGLSGGGPRYSDDSDGIIYDNFGSSNIKTTANPSDNLAAWHVYNVRAASGAWSNHVNGTQIFSTATNTVAWTTVPLIGRDDFNSKLMAGSIADIILFNRVLNDATERKPKIHAYLNNTYGFSLPTS